MNAASDNLRGGAIAHGREVRNILVLVNPKAGLFWSFDGLRRALVRHWDVPGNELFFQFTQSREDGIAKTRRAVAAGVDCILAIGGDGTLNTVASELVGSGVALGVIPGGSGNGFARHFEIPLHAESAVSALATGVEKMIDVGTVNGHKFFVTCSMAWDASLVRSFERSPVRGIVPYIFAGVHELFEYSPQCMQVSIDSNAAFVCEDAMVFTIANLTQFGGGARIAPRARSDDGHLELVIARRQDIPKLFANIVRLFDGSIDCIPEVTSRRFQRLSIERDVAAPVQIDGELVDMEKSIEVGVVPAGLRVIVPS